MKPSEQWKQFNDNQSWKHLPSDWKSHKAVEDGSRRRLTKTLRLSLTPQEVEYLKAFKGKNKHFYPTLESAIEAIFSNIANKPMEDYLKEPKEPTPLIESKEPPIKLTIVINAAITERLNTMKIYGKNLSTNAKIRFLLANSTELQQADYFENLINLKPKNPSRKEVI